MRRGVTGKLCLTALFFMLAFSVPAGAATVRELKLNTTYTGLDFNGDGRADVFRAYGYDHRSGKVKLRLNGSTRAIFVARGTGITYYRYSPSQIYLFVYGSQYGGSFTEVYRYNGNTLKSLGQIGGVMARTYFKKASGDYVYIAAAPYHQDNITSFQNVMLSNNRITTFLMKYRIDTAARRFRLASSYASAAGAYYITYTGNTFTTSSVPSVINQNGMVLKPGMKVKLTKIWFRSYQGNGYTGHVIRYQVSAGGKSGWFESSRGISFR